MRLTKTCYYTGMSLVAYQKKRNVLKSPEPKGKMVKQARGSLFVIHKHAASHLHYDLRLSIGGILRSWAVPKGPSLDSSIKHLAIEVEDHPLSYSRFEGTIPEGHYGAGEVIVWDRGTYKKTPGEKEVAVALRAGAFSFILHGKKLRGEFSLVRLKRPKQWLLIKKRDEFSSTKDITKDDRSVISGKKLPNGTTHEVARSK